MAFNKVASIALAALLLAACISAQLETVSEPAPAAAAATTEGVTRFTTTSSSSSSTSTTAAPETTSSTSTSTSTSTTAAPQTTSTTTEVVPVPTTVKPEPHPTPAPALNRWTFSENNQTCLIVQMAAQLNVTYLTKADTNATTLWNLPSNNHTVGGSCTNVTDTLKVDLGNGNALHLEFGYAVNDTQHYELAHVQLVVNATQFPNAKANQTLRLVNNVPHFTTHAQNSYHCTRVQQLNLTASDAPANSTTVAAVLDVSRLQLEAFHKAHDDHFSAAHDCDAIDTPDIVPIAVGCALVALVVLMLIAYLCARRRSQTHGYLSM